jgi:hypothetical protein
MKTRQKNAYKKIFKWIAGISAVMLVVATAVLYPQETQALTGDGSGGTITHVGNYTIHTFTSSGTFNPGPYVSKVEVLVVGGGGGGGGVIGGGGGGGGVVYNSSITVTPNTNYTVTVGAGGNGGKGWQGDAGSTHPGSNGGSSSFNGVTALGGGGGASSAAAKTGSSGGGGGFGSVAGASGTSGQGHSGGTSSDSGNKGAGGGGAGANGSASGTYTTSDGSCSTGQPGSGWVCRNGGWLPPDHPGLGYGGAGGAGVANSISGSSVYYGGGGGGGVRYAYGNGGAGGAGGGGAGSNVTTGAVGGTNGLGGGGGGAGYNTDSGSLTGGKGGSGVVIIKYSNIFGAISANPTTCVASGGSSTCSSAITWSTYNWPSGQVSLVKQSVNGGSEYVFSCSGQGTTNVNGTFTKGNTYVLKLYQSQNWTTCPAGQALGPALATVTVTATAGPSCTSATPDGDWTTATTGTRQVFANGVANASDVYFPTWSGTTSAEQDDIVWYHLGNGVTNLGGGTWRADVNLANHPGLGTISTHVYLYSAATGQVFCDSANATRLNTGTVQVNSNTSTTWTVTCSLTNPTCPNITQSTASTSQTYTGKPYSNWTLTPATKPGYDYQVDGCAINTPCTKTLN